MRPLLLCSTDGNGSISPLQALVKLSLSAAMCCPKFNDRTTFNSCHWR